MTANTTSVVGSFILAAGKYVPVISVQVSGNTVTLLLSDVGGIIPANFATGAAASYTYINEADFNFVVDELPINGSSCWNYRFLWINGSSSICKRCIN